MNLIQSFLTKNPCYTCGRTITPTGLMLHSVGCPQPSAAVFVKNWNRADYDRACVHAFIDGNTGTFTKAEKRGRVDQSGLRQTAVNSVLSVCYY